MQSASDPFLGWHRHEALDGRLHDFYVRQLWDGKASVEVTDLDRQGLEAYGEMCGRTLARGHARSGDRVAIAAYLGEDDRFDRAIAEYASVYADVSETDHEMLLEAIAQGRLRAVTGV
jgi:sugar/nucleoside kinase (ribokinase family)